MPLLQASVMRVFLSGLRAIRDCAQDCGAVNADRTFDWHDVIIPNAELIAGSVTNLTLNSKTGRVIMPLGVAYGSDIILTKQILLEAARQQ